VIPKILRVLLLLLVTSVANAATRRVVIADANGWSTAVALGAGGASESVRVTDCTLGPIVLLDIAANGSALLRDAGRYQCHLHNGFGLLPLSFSGIAESRLFFIDRGSGAKSSLTVPSLDVPLDATNLKVRMRLVTNDDIERTFIVVFGPPAPLTLRVYNEHNNQIGVELIDRNDFDLLRGYLFYALKTEVGAGSIELTQENSEAAPPNVGNETYYGFAVVSRPDGTAAAVRLWAPVAAPAAVPPAP